MFRVECSFNGVTFLLHCMNYGELKTNISALGFELTGSSVLGFLEGEWEQLSAEVHWSLFDMIKVPDPLSRPSTVTHRPSLPSELLARTLVPYLSQREIVAVASNLAAECESAGCGIDVRPVSRYLARTTLLRELYLRDALFSCRVGHQTLGLETDTTPWTWNSSALHQTATWQEDEKLSSYPLHVSMVQVRRKEGQLTCWEKLLSHHKKFNPLIAASAFTSQLSDRGEHCLVIGLRAFECTHRTHLLQRGLAEGFGCSLDSGTDSSELASRIMQIVSYISGNSAFNEWLALHDIVIVGSLFWERASNVRFGGICAAAYVLCSRLGRMPIYDWAVERLKVCSARASQHHGFWNFLQTRIIANGSVSWPTSMSSRTDSWNVLAVWQFGCLPHRKLCATSGI